MAYFSAAESVKRARAATGLTQAELATRAGVSRITVHQVEAGGKDPRLSTLLVLFRALGLELVIVPTSLRPAVEDFVRSGGRLVGQPAGTNAPLSVVDEIKVEVARAEP